MVEPNPNVDQNKKLGQLFMLSGVNNDQIGLIRG